MEPKTKKILIGSAIGVGALIVAVLIFKNKSTADGAGGKGKGEKGGGAMGGDATAGAGPDDKGGDGKGKGKGKEKNKSKNSGSGSAGGDSADAANVGNAGTTPDGTPITAPTTEAPAAAEGSPIVYIAQGKGKDNNSIGVRVGVGVFAPGTLVQLTHPSYNGQFTITDNWDSGDGTGLVYINTPFNSATANTNSAGNLEDDQAGTIQVIGDPATAPAPDSTPAASFSGIPEEGASLEFSNATGKKAKKRRHIRLIPASEAKQRIANMAAGASKGLKGNALRNFIKANVKRKK